MLIPSSMYNRYYVDTKAICRHEEVLSGYKRYYVDTKAIYAGTKRYIVRVQEVLCRHKGDIGRHEEVLSGYKRYHVDTKAIYAGTKRYCPGTRDTIQQALCRNDR